MVDWLRKAMFGKLNAEIERETAAANERQAAVDAVKSWRPIGTSVKYLGRNMRVVGHVRWAPYGLYGTAIWPQLSLRYADDRGEVHELHVGGEDLAALMGEQELAPNEELSRRPPAGGRLE